MKKNMAVSEVGVACHMNMKRVGHKILGSLTVSHRKTNCDFDCSINPAAAALVAPRGVIFGSSCAGREGSSRTRPATAEVINGKTAVTPNTNLQIIKSFKSDLKHWSWPSKQYYRLSSKDPHVSL